MAVQAAARVAEEPVAAARVAGAGRVADLARAPAGVLRMEAAGHPAAAPVPEGRAAATTTKVRHDLRHNRDVCGN
jgi:hypothetical protein